MSVSTKDLSAMEFFPGMDVSDGKMLRKVLDYREAYEPESFKARDVEAALSKDRVLVEDFMALLSPAALPYLEDMARKAKATTRARFGRNVSLFTPLYIANYCGNGCRYCGFNSQQKIKRSRLTNDELQREMEAIAATGLEDILILTGESPQGSSVEWIGEALKMASKYFSTVGIEIYPANNADYAYLHECGADFVTVFQETYDPVAYDYYHPYGNKRSLPFRFYAQERALANGFRGAGFAALLGLSDFRKDALATGIHLNLVQELFPEAELSFSIPRLRPVAGHKMTNNGVSEKELLQMMFAYRLFQPQAGMTVSTRERPGFRDAVIDLCATRISAGVSVDVGGHATEDKSSEQFDIADPRSVKQIDDVIRSKGLQPVYSDFIHL